MNYTVNNVMGGHPCLKPEMLQDTTANTLMYPEMYYKVQPHIMMACDEMDMHGVVMPTREMIHCMCERICVTLFRVHPELAAYDMDYPVGTMADPPQEFDEHGRPMQRGPFRDFLLFLLLSEFFRRRRGY
jgi:hypothetical protein